MLKPNFKRKKGTSRWSPLKGKICSSSAPSIGELYFKEALRLIKTSFLTKIGREISFRGEWDATWSISKIGKSVYNWSQTIDFSNWEDETEHHGEAHAISERRYAEEGGWDKPGLNKRSSGADPGLSNVQKFFEKVLDKRKFWDAKTGHLVDVLKC